MYQFYVTEVRKTQSGEYEHENFWVYDEDNYTARLKGEAKFHEVLSRAATSAYAEHGAILFDSRCRPIMHSCFDHIQTAVQEPVMEVEE